MSSVRSGPRNAEWVKTTDTGHDINCGTADFKSGADYGDNKVKETTFDVKHDVIIDDIKKDIDATKASKGSAWDQTRDIAGNICGAVKHGAEAGWHKIAGN